FVVGARGLEVGSKTRVGAARVNLEAVRALVGSSESSVENDLARIETEETFLVVAQGTFDSAHGSIEAARTIEEGALALAVGSRTNLSAAPAIIDAAPELVVASHGNTRAAPTDVMRDLVH